MWELKEYKKISVITLSNGNELMTDKSPEEILKVVNSGVKFVNIGGKVVNVNAIWTIDPKQADDINMFILGITDTIVRDRLNDIKKERENKWLKLNGVQHLIQIYEDRFWEIGMQKL